MFQVSTIICIFAASNLKEQNNEQRKMLSATVAVDAQLGNT